MGEHRPPSPPSPSPLTYVSSVVLHGLDLESEHCVFENQNGTVTLVPLNGAQCSVNGVLLTEPAPLNQGERPVLGLVLGPVPGVWTGFTPQQTRLLWFQAPSFYWAEPTCSASTTRRKRPG